MARDFYIETNALNMKTKKAGSTFVHVYLHNRTDAHRTHREGGSKHSLPAQP